jgi:hypothetical protein
VLLTKLCFQPSYIFQIDEIFEDLGGAPALYDNFGAWQPTSGPHASHNFIPKVGASGRTWLCDGSQIYEVALPRNAQLYKTFSVYYASGAGFWVLNGDARNPPDADIFHRLQFNYHTQTPESSFLTNAGQNNILCVQPQDNRAARMLLPDIYHTNATASSPQHGGIVGELPIFLALMAFTTSREYLPSVLPYMFAGGNWITTHTWQFASMAPNS